MTHLISKPLFMEVCGTIIHGIVPLAFANDKFVFAALRNSYDFAGEFLSFYKFGKDNFRVEDCGSYLALIPYGFEHTIVGLDSEDITPEEKRIAHAIRVLEERLL